MLAIRGVATIPLNKMVRVIQAHNSRFDARIAWAYYDLAPIFDLNPSAALCQAIHETGWFTSYRAVKQNNFAGIGVTSDATIGAVDVSVIGGVLRHYSHLAAYAVSAINAWAQLIDTRYDLVKKLYGNKVAVYYTDLNGKWAVPGTNYGQSIEAIHNAIRDAK